MVEVSPIYLEEDLLLVPPVFPVWIPFMTWRRVRRRQYYVWCVTQWRQKAWCSHRIARVLKSFDRCPEGSIVPCLPKSKYKPQRDRRRLFLWRVRGGGILDERSLLVRRGRQLSVAIWLVFSRRRCRRPAGSDQGMINNPVCVIRSSSLGWEATSTYNRFLITEVGNSQFQSAIIPN